MSGPTRLPNALRLTPLDEQLALLQEIGRMGLWERDIASGVGRWDAAAFRIFGFDPAETSPPYEEVMLRVDPEDRAAVREHHRALALQSGRADIRYRVHHPDGRVRHLHSIAEVRCSDDAPARLVGVVIDDTDGVELMRAERAASEVLHKAVALAGVSVWRIDLAQQRVHFNPHAARYVGVEHREGGIPLDEVRRRIHPEDRDAVTRAAEEALTADRPIDVIARYLQSDGNWRTLLTRRVAERDEAGAVVGLGGISLDVSRLVGAREQMLRLRERMTAIADAAGLGMWSRDAESGRVEWNEQMFRIHHRRPSEGAPTVDEWLARHVHPADRERIAHEQRTADEAWTPTYHSEFRVPAPDGEVRWVYAWSRREWRDGQRFAFGLHVDITDRRSAEFELQSQRQRTEFALSAAGVGLWQRGMAGEGMYWSEGMYRLRGLDPRDPRPIEELALSVVDAEEKCILDDLQRRHVEHGVPYEHEFRVFRPDGVVCWLATRGQVVRDADGNPLYIAGVNFDVTERREAEAILREKLRAEQASRAKSEFMARMSHELRTPMNAVLGFAQLLAEDPDEPPSERQRERLDRIRAGGEHLLALINDVLDLSSIDADERDLAREAVALDAAADGALQWVGRLAEQSGVGLRRATLHGAVVADRRRLAQVLSNLLSNAVKYNRRGGWVELATMRRRGDRAQRAIVVRDSGRGLTASEIARLWEPFERFGAEQRGIDGTGIGLTIVRRLVERMGGEVEVLSTPGEGSEFRVWLDEADSSEAPKAPDAVGSPQPEGTALPLRVVCIEDNPVNLLLVRELFALRPAVRLLTASTGAEGIRLAIDERPDLVLLDLHLPDIDGLDVLARLRKEPRLGASRIVALSANAMPADVQSALDAGFDDYWTKPIDIPRFLERIDALAAARPSGR